jgi:hypothetical protein
MLIDRVETGFPDTISQPAAARVDVRRLTTAQLRVLGVTQVAYLTTSRPGDGFAEYVMRGADGVVVATFDELELVREVAHRLGLAVVPVH